MSFKVGDEVAVVDGDGQAWRISKIIGEWDGKWRTDFVSGPNAWSKTGQLRERGYGKQRIVPATAEHRRQIRLRDWYWHLRDPRTWEKASAETIEAVAKLLGWT